jgi:ribosome-binding factor A
VSDVEVTRDLDWATVWVTALLPQQSKEVVKALNELAVEFRRSLSRSMRLRRVPELRFKYDDSVDKGERIEQLLRERPPRDAD